MHNKHVKKRTRFRHREKLSFRQLLRRGLVLGSAGLFLTGFVLLARYIVNTISAYNTQSELQALHASAAPENSPVPQESLSPTQASEASNTPETLEAAGSQTPAPRAVLSPGAAMLSEFLPFYRRNSDISGWLKSDAVGDIDFPIVHKDNIYYLNRDFYKRKNLSGSVFLDEGCSILPRDKNLILHGHNMKNGTMFGKLHLLMNADTIKAHPFFTFSTLYESDRYLPYAVALVSINPGSPRYFQMLEANYPSELNMALYVNRLRALSVLSFPTDMNGDDILLTLATCHGNEDDERLIVALRALRPGESEETLMRQFSSGVSTRK